MKRITLVLSLIISSITFAQKDGAYLTSESPVNQLWEHEAGEGGAEIAGMDQQFFFLIPDGSSSSMMAPFEMEGMGFACPTEFVISLDDTYLYIEIAGEPCAVDLPEEEKYIKIQYEMSTDGKTLVLIVDGVRTKYIEWQG
jgi:hypothetical protein